MLISVYFCTGDNKQITNHHCYHLSAQIGDITVENPPYNENVISNLQLII